MKSAANLVAVFVSKLGGKEEKPRPKKTAKLAVFFVSG